MHDYPTCSGCDRSAPDRIGVRGVNWDPDLKEVRPSVWECWACRGGQHPDMPEGYVPDSFSQPTE